MAFSQYKVTPYLVYLVFITTLGPLQFGYHLAELNAPQSVITCERQSIHSSVANLSPQCIHMNPSQFGLVSSIYTLGGLLGALLAGPVATRYGRLFVLRATTIFFILGPLAMTMAGSIAVISVGRLVAGVGAGAAIVVGPIYISEIAPHSARGFFGAFTQIMTNVGILLTQTLGLFMSRGNKWRQILFIAGVIGFAELLGLFFVPESPIWLAEHQKTTQARQVLQRIRGKNADIHAEIEGWNVSTDPADPSAEEESLLEHPSGEASSKQPPVTILRAITDPEYRQAIIAVIGVMVAQQFTGINSIVMYSVSLLQTILPTTAALLTVMISAINLVITLACSPLPDKIGRRKCLLLSITGVGIDSVLLALGIYFNQKALSSIAALLFVAFFAVGLGPVPFILSSELVGPEAVGATQSLALGANWIATFVVAQFFPVVNDALGGRGKVYWIFAVLAGVMGSFIYKFVPETKDKANADEVWGRENRRRD
ncbi:hypothetical protein SI65_09835 [Aspergillus cristatus]|uniref:Major facilitator superfamily (MFS) profile domain-containing protein n=1 Tax=Aspergillus cristatus TaxID=573508 RepID=A0A1E3B1Y3_ASPCR|nr:hypothetical protein SI65_09835 [Aspergillus cristatus]